jgi:hypothetical protein
VLRETPGPTVAALDVGTSQTAAEPPRDREPLLPLALAPVAPIQPAAAPPRTDATLPAGAAAAPAPPTVRVTIGRIEVRAVTLPAPVTPRPAVPPALSLEEYLRRGGRP